jgi:hypothetical protein
MPEWKLRIFVRVIRARMDRESRAAEELLAEYPRLIAEERCAIVEALARSVAMG